MASERLKPMVEIESATADDILGGLEGFRLMNWALQEVNNAIVWRLNFRVHGDPFRSAMPVFSNSAQSNGTCNVFFGATLRAAKPFVALKCDLRQSRRGHVPAGWKSRTG